MSVTDIAARGEYDRPQTTHKRGCRKGAKMRADSDKKKKIARYVFLAATVVVCVGLCVGSLLPGDVSAATSDNFGSIVDDTLEGAGIDKDEIIAENDIDDWQLFVRKLFGHFGAFLFLGVLATVTFILFHKPGIRSLLATIGGVAVFGFAFACLTELLQTDLFTTGRGASFDDVITDCRGFFSSALAVLAVWLIVLGVRRMLLKKRYGTLLSEAAADVYERERADDDALSSPPALSSSAPSSRERAEDGE